MIEATFVVIGGGIAGVSCAEGLSILAPEEKTVLISASPTIKAVTNLVPLTKLCMQFNVEERTASSLNADCPSLEVITDIVESVDSDNHLLNTASGLAIKYKKLCVCTGARPKIIWKNKHVVGIRDTDSVEEFQQRIKHSRRVVIVGNGGIATELVHELEGIEIIWVIKDKHISATFIDPGAAEFFQSRLKKSQSTDEGPVKRMKFTVSDVKSVAGGGGAALGPDWHSKVNLQGLLNEKGRVTVEYCCEVSEIITPEASEWPVAVKLTNGHTHWCDLIVSATGVIPNTDCVKSINGLELCPDGGIKVDDKMQTNIQDVFAAGDVCTASWDLASQWFQMRLWTQARQMGSYAAKALYSSLTKQEMYQDFCFELFTHVTKFFGMKVVLLGLFNGQRLGEEYDLLLRVTKGEEYIKLVMKSGRLQGAVLIGDTDLEEMCENLILNQLDLTDFGEDLLNPDIDIEDYFD